MWHSTRDITINDEVSFTNFLNEKALANNGILLSCYVSLPSPRHSSEYTICPLSKKEETRTVFTRNEGLC
jgi:hypothetical protein